MAAITAAGSGSGIDIEMLVTKLTEAERAPVQNQIDLKTTQINAKVTAYNALKGALTDFQKAFSGLTKLSDVAKRTATSSDTDVFTVSASSTAISSSTDIQIDRLAQAHKLVSSGFESSSSVVGNGTLTISLGGSAFSVTVADAENDTLTKIRDSINNAEDNPGITASILTVADPDNAGETLSKLVLTSDDTGVDNAITVAVTDGDGNDTDTAGLSRLVYNPGVTENLTQIQAAQDARIYVDGFEATSSSNTFSNVIQGVTITAVSADPGETHKLKVGVDKDSIKTKVTDFVSAYNAFQKTLKYLTDYDSEKEQAGLLTGDSAARSISTQILRIVTASNETDTGEYSSFASIGIIKNREGEMELDADTLSEALADDFDGVSNLLAGTNGIIAKLDDAVENMAVSDEGVLATRNNTLKEQLKDIDKQKIALDLRMTSVEKRLRQQFTTMDIIVAQFKSTGDFLTQQLESISGSKK